MTTYRISTSRYGHWFIYSPLHPTIAVFVHPVDAAEMARLAADQDSEASQARIRDIWREQSPYRCVTCGGGLLVEEGMRCPTCRAG